MADDKNRYANWTASAGTVGRDTRARRVCARGISAVSTRITSEIVYVSWATPGQIIANDKTRSPSIKHYAIRVFILFHSYLSRAIIIIINLG